MPVPVSVAAALSLPPVILSIRPVPVVLRSLCLEVRPILSATLVSVQTSLAIVLLVTNVAPLAVLVIIITAHVERLVLITVVVVFLLAFRLRVQKVPTTTIEESFRIVDYSFHDFPPVEGLDPLRVLYVARVEPFLDMVKHGHGDSSDHR